MLAFCSESPSGSYSQPSYFDFPQNITKHILSQKQWYVMMGSWYEERIVEGHGEIALRRGSLTARDTMDFNMCNIQKHAFGAPCGAASTHTKGP